MYKLCLAINSATTANVHLFENKHFLWTPPFFGNIRK